MFRIFEKKSMVALIAFFCAVLMAGGIALGVGAFEKYFPGNVLFGGKIQIAHGYGQQDMKFSYVSATEIRVGSPATALLCVGLNGGAEEIGTTEGYVTVGDGADFFRFMVQVPETLILWGDAGDLIPYFDTVETAAGATIDVRIFEYGNTTAIITDTIVLTDGAARAWNTLNTLSSGIGADADIAAGEFLIFELTPNANTDDFNIYGFRWQFSKGLERQLAAR